MVGSSVGVGVGVSVGSPVGGIVGSGVGVAVGSSSSNNVGVGSSEGDGNSSGALQSFIGTVPLRKYSGYADDVAVFARKPFSLQTGVLISPDGAVNRSIDVPRNAFSMRSLQIGAAPRLPAMLSIGVLSLLPTQTPTTRLGV